MSCNAMVYLRLALVIDGEANVMAFQVYLHAEDRLVFVDLDRYLVLVPRSNRQLVERGQTADVSALSILYILFFFFFWGLFM